MNRRSLLLGLVAAPAVIRTAGLLMPVRRIEPVETFTDWLKRYELELMFRQEYPARFMQREVYDENFVRWVETHDTLTGRLILNTDGRIPQEWYAPASPTLAG